MTLLSLAVFLAAASGTPPPAETQPFAATALLTEPTLPEYLPLAAQDGPQGSPFSYTFVEVGAIAMEIDDLSSSDDDVDAFYGRGQLGLFDFLYVFGEYENQSADFQNTDTDLISLGAGAHLGLAHTLDLMGEVGWLYSDVSSDLSTLDDTTNGYEVRAGLRWMLTSWEGGGLELNGGGLYVELENQLASDDERLGWEAGARLHFLKLFSVGAGYAMLEDDDQASLNARVSF